MKRLFLLIGVALLVANANAQWKTNGPYGGTVQCFAIGTGAFFAGTNDGVFYSANNGVSWMPVNNGSSGNSVYSLITSGSMVFAGTYQQGVYASANNGASWLAVNNGLPANTIVFALAVSDTNIFAGTNYGMYLSTNNGASWKSLSNGISGQVRSLAVSGANIYAGTPAGVFTSANNGTSWTVISSLSAVYGLSLAVSGSSIWVGTTNGVYLSTNGSSWAAVSTGLPAYTDINSLAVNGAHVFAAAADSGVYVTTNNGTSWKADNNGLKYFATDAAYPTVHALINATTGVFAGTDDGVFLTANNGASWAASDSGILNTGILSFTRLGANVLAGSESGVFLSGNYGSSWLPVDSGLPATGFSALATSGTNVFAASTGVNLGTGIYLSANNGINWSAADNSLFNTDNIVSLLVTGSGILAGNSDEDVYLTADNGNTWLLVDSFLQSDPLVYDPVYSMAYKGDTLFAGTQKGVFFYNTHNWVGPHSGLTNYSVYALIVSGSNIFAGTSNGVYLSSNNGSTWNSMSTGLTNNTVMALAISGSYIFAGTNGGGIFYSTNNGGNWTAWNTGLSNLYITTLLINDSVIFAGTSGSGVWQQLLPGYTPPLAATIKSDSDKCYNTCDAMAVVTATNGNGKYTYIWNTVPPQTSDTAFNLCAGTYKVMVYDSLLDSASANITIVQPARIYDSVSATICYDQAYYGHYSTGSYTDTFTIRSGCDSIRFLSLVVNPAIVSADTERICSGDTLNGHTTAGHYVDTLTTTNGCDSIAMLELEVDGLPVMPVIVQYGDTLMTIQSYFRYAWYDGNNAATGDTSNLLILTTGGNYYVRVANSNSLCYNTSALFNADYSGVGTLMPGTTSLCVYPNPTSMDNWQCEVGSGLIGSVIELLDEQGQLVFSSMIRSSKSQIPTGELPAGVYYLRISNYQENRVAKLVKL